MKIHWKVHLFLVLIAQGVLLSFQLNDQNPFTINYVRADNDRILVVVLYLIRHQE